MASALPIEMWPQTSIDPTKNLAAAANETSQDQKYLRHQFVTWQGWVEPNRGWTPPEAREAIEAHLKGWPYMAASLARHLPRFALVLGALVQRTAPPLRTQWKHEKSRGPQWAVDELDDVWAKQFRPDYETRLRDMALLGGSVIHVHYVPDVEAGLERPVLKRWPHEAIFWRAASPAFPGGWYAITADSGLVRMTPGDGHWFFLAHGERWHELASLLALGELFVAGKLSERDEAGLSEAAGRASPVGTLTDGTKISDENGQALIECIANLGRARKGAVKPFGTELEAFEIVSDTQFFDRYGGRQLLKIALSVLGQSATLSPGANGVYQPIVSWSVADALSDKDHEATVRGWDEGLVRPFREINAINSDVHLVGERYADKNAKAEAVAKRAKLYAETIEAWKKAGLDPSQEDADALADQLSTQRVAMVKLGIELDTTLLGAALLGREARAAYRLPPFGDERDDETLAHLLKAGPAGAMPTPGETATPQAPIPVPGPNAAAPPGAPDVPPPPAAPSQPTPANEP